ncbi:MAG TPA: hypothetical protein PKH77_06110 [Anaerolineae bacterium]|nr:hypothetical protein [Anaerolineae bacterium]
MVFSQGTPPSVAANANVPLHFESDPAADLPPRYVLEVRKTAPLCVMPGRPFTYQIQYQNNLTDQTFYNVVVTDTLPAYVSYTGGAGWVCAAQVCTYQIAEIPPGAGGAVDLPVSLSATFPYPAQTSLRNVVRTRYSFFSLLTTVGAGFDLAVEMRSHGAGRLAAGDLVTYTITYSNVGTALAEDVVLTETLPAYTVLVSAGWQAVGGQVYTLALGDVPAGYTGNVQVVVRLAASLPPALTEIVNQVDIGGAGLECDLTHNRAIERTPIHYVTGTQLYVSNLDSNTIDIYDAQTYAYMGSFAAGYHPFGMAADGGLLYVLANTAPDATASKLLMVDLSTRQILTEVVVGFGAIHVAVLEDHLYVTNNNNGDGITILDKRGNIKDRFLQFGFFGIDSDPGRRRVYVAKLYMGGEGLWTITPTGGGFQWEFRLKTKPLAPHSLLYHPDTDRIYVAFGMDSELHVYDPDTFALLGRYATEIQDPAMPGHGGHGLAAVGMRIYVSNYLGRSVSVLDESGRLLSDPGAKGDALWTIRLPLVVCANGPAPLVSRATAALALPAIPVNGHPKGIAANASRVFVTLPNENRIAVIDPATLAVVHEIPTVGRYPHFALLVEGTP